MLRSWKRIYVLGALGVVFGADSCLDRKEELPHSIVPSAEARESASAIREETRALELRFEIDSPVLLREDETALEDFLRRSAASGRIQSIKVMVWAPLDQGGRPAKGLGQQRLEALRDLIGRTGIAAQFFLFSEKPERDFAERSQAAVLAILE